MYLFKAYITSYDSSVFRKMVKIRICSVPSKEDHENTIQKMLERGHCFQVIHGFSMKAANAPSHKLCSLGHREPYSGEGEG